MICENCGENHDGSYGSGRFCKKECARGFSTKAKRKEISKKVSITLGGTGRLKNKSIVCLKCGEPLKTGYKFCSRVCHSLYKTQMYNLEVEKTGKFNQVCSNTLRPKQYLIEKYGHKCMICKNTEWMKQPIPLVFDHIDGNSDNWNLDNCRIICHNCNAQTDTFAGRNTGKGNSNNRRSNYRKQRYNSNLKW